MAKNSFTDWDTTAANNTDIASIPLGENLMFPSNVNNAFREVMAQLKSGVQPLDADLTAIAALAKTDGNIIVGDGTNWVAESGATARASLGLTIGTHVQAYDADLTTLGGLTKTDGNFIVADGTNWTVESGATARTSLGLGTIATQASSSVSITGGSITGITDLPIADGGTGASSAGAARANLGLANSSTDNALVRFDGANGQTQNSSATLSDVGKLTVSDLASDSALITNDCLAGYFSPQIGVDFTDIAGAGGTSNLLNDYEEGTFTPTIIGTTSAGSGTYSVQTGAYTKIGRAVAFQLQLTWSAHTGTGFMRIAGLPFTSGAIETVVSLWASGITFTGSSIQGYVNGGATEIILSNQTSGGGASLDIDTAGTLWASGTYYV